MMTRILHCPPVAPPFWPILAKRLKCLKIAWKREKSTKYLHGEEKCKVLFIDLHAGGGNLINHVENVH